LGIYHLVKPIT